MEIKPCPFCSGKTRVITKVAKSLDGYKPSEYIAYVTCSKCGAIGKPVSYFGGGCMLVEEQAVEEWNTWCDLVKNKDIGSTRRFEKEGKEL